MSSDENDSLDVKIDFLLSQYKSKDYEKYFVDPMDQSLDAVIDEIIKVEVAADADADDDESLEQQYSNDSVNDSIISNRSDFIIAEKYLEKLLSQDDNIDADFCERYDRACNRKTVHPKYLGKVFKENYRSKHKTEIMHKDSVLVINERAIRKSAATDSYAERESSTPAHIVEDETTLHKEDRLLKENLLYKQKAHINLIGPNSCEEWYGKKFSGTELHLSDAEDHDNNIDGKFIKHEQQYDCREQFRKFLSLMSKELMKHEKDENEGEGKKKPVVNVIGEELNNFLKKIDLVHNIRIKSRPLDLPSLGNLVFPLTPYNHNYPTECYEAFSTGSLYLGTANLFGMNGHGTYVFPNGATYQGQFKDNMFHGVGRIIYPNKTVVEGIWYNGELLEPKVYFNDGIYYDPENWDYLKFPDRRYLSEKFRGLLPDNDPQLTNEHPARPLPEGCYDTGEGYYSVKTKCLHDPHTGTYIRIPTALEARWIIENCRSSEDHNVPFMSHMFPAQYNVFYPREDLVLDPIWFNQTYPQLDSEITKAVRTEIIGDIDQLRYCLTRETMLKYCIPILQKDSPKSYPAFERHRVRDLAPWVMNVPESFGMFIISPEIALQKICIGEIKQRTNLELLKDYNDEKLEFNKFIKVLNKIDAFINGRKIVWDVKTEARVLNALQTFHYLDECIANGALTLNRIHKKGKLNKRFIVKALKLWTEGKSPENKLIQTKHVEVYARKLRRYKRFLLEAKLSSTTYTSADSPTEFYPKLEMYAPYNWKMSTINKIKREKHIIFAHKSDRN